MKETEIIATKEGQRERLASGEAPPCLSHQVLLEEGQWVLGGTPSLEASSSSQTLSLALPGPWE